MKSNDPEEKRANLLKHLEALAREYVKAVLKRDIKMLGMNQEWAEMEEKRIRAEEERNKDKEDENEEEPKAKADKGDEGTEDNKEPTNETENDAEDKTEKPAGRTTKKIKARIRPLTDDNPRIEQLLHTWAEVVMDWCMEHSSPAYYATLDVAAKRMLTARVLQEILNTSYCDTPATNAPTQEGAQPTGEGAEDEEEEEEMASWPRRIGLGIAVAGAVLLLAGGAALYLRSRNQPQ